MTAPSEATLVRLEVGESDGIEEITLCFRKDGTRHELASVEPPLVAEVQTFPEDE